MDKPKQTDKPYEVKEPDKYDWQRIASILALEVVEHEWYKNGPLPANLAGFVKALQQKVMDDKLTKLDDMSDTFFLDLINESKLEEAVDVLKWAMEASEGTEA